MLLFRAILLIFAISITLASLWRLSSPRGTFFGSLLVLTSLAWVVELVGAVTGQLGIRNVVLYNGYAAIEFITLLSMVHCIRPTWRMGLLVALLVGLVGMAYSVVMHGATAYLALEGLLTISIVSSIVFLLVLLDLARTSLTPLQNSSHFWLFVGALVYFGGVIPVLGSWKFIGQLNKALSQTLYWTVVLLAITRYLFTAFACRKERMRIEQVE
jgi:hypothetical protein